MSIPEKSGLLIDLTQGQKYQVEAYAGNIYVVVEGRILTYTDGKPVAYSKGETFTAQGWLIGVNLSNKVLQISQEMTDRLPEKFRDKLNAGDKEDAEQPAVQGEYRSSGQITYNHEVTCPVCSARISITRYSESKLMLEQEDPDLRRHYQDFEPLYYNVALCPKCGYSNYTSNFLTLNDSDKRILSQNGGHRPEHYDTDLENAIYKCQTAISCLEQISAPPQERGRLYLHLAWLYADNHQDDLSNQEKEKALHAFTEIYFSSNSDEKSLLYYIYMSGELSFELQQYKDAYRYFYKFLENVNTKHRLAEQARERISLIRKNMLAEKGSAELE
jgi:uncharacterized protein (DUF2225 family)